MKRLPLCLFPLSVLLLAACGGGGSSSNTTTASGTSKLTLRLSEHLTAGLVGLPLGVNGLPTALHQQYLANLQEAIA